MQVKKPQTVAQAAAIKDYIDQHKMHTYPKELRIKIRRCVLNAELVKDDKVELIREIQVNGVIVGSGKDVRYVSYRSLENYEVK